MSQAYPLLLAAASIAGLVWLDRRLPAEYSRRLESGVAILAGGLAGARLGFVALHLPYYMAYPDQIAWLWQGGLSWIGAVAGALVAAAVVALMTETSFWSLLDVLAVPAGLVALAVWTGCLVEACAYGKAASWAPPGYDYLGRLAPRWPTQALGMVLSGGLLAGLLPLAFRRLPPGALGAATLAALAAVNAVLSLTRGDPSLLIGEWRLDSVAALATFVTAGGAALWRARRPTP